MNYYNKELEKVSQESMMWKAWKIVLKKIYGQLFWKTFDKAGMRRLMESMDPTYGGIMKMKTLNLIINRIITTDRGNKHDNQLMVNTANVSSYLVWNERYLIKPEEIRQAIDGALGDIKTLETVLFDQWLNSVAKLDPTLSEEAYAEAVIKIFQVTLGDNILNQFTVSDKFQTVDELPADNEPSLYTLKIRNHLQYFSRLHTKLEDLRKGKGKVGSLLKQEKVVGDHLDAVMSLSDAWFLVFNNYFTFIYKALHYLALSANRGYQADEVMKKLFIDLEEIDDNTLLSHLKHQQLIDSKLSLEEVLSSVALESISTEDETSEDTEQPTDTDTNEENTGESTDGNLDNGEDASGETETETTEASSETTSSDEETDESTTEVSETTREETRPTRPESEQVGEVVNPDAEKEAIKAYLEPLMGDKLEQLKLFSASEVNRPLYHISMDGSIQYFTPQISKRTLSTEDRSLPRISTSTCLVGCMNGYQSTLHDMDNRYAKQFNGIFTVYDLPYQYAIKPAKKLLADVEYTDEYWLVSWKKETYRTVPKRIAEFTIPKIERVYGKDTVDETYQMYLKVNQGEFYLNHSLKLSPGYYSVLLKGYHVNYPLDGHNLIEVTPISERDYQLVTSLSLSLNTR